MSHSQKTAQGIVWSTISYGGGKLLAFVSTTILTRLIAPELFGPVELALVAVTILDAIGDLGIGAALIVHRDDTERAASVSFMVSVVMGIVLWATATLAAPAVGAYFADPQVTPLLRVLALNFVIQSLGNTHSSLLSKNLNFKRKLLPDLTRTFAKGVCSIVLALAGWGAWSVVWGQVVGEIATTISLWIAQPFRPRWVWDTQLLRTMLVFGAQLLGVELVSVLYGNADYVIVGKVLGTTDLALYRRAFTISSLLIISVCFVTARVLFPSFARLRGDNKKLHDAYIMSVRYTALVTLPLAAGLCAVAPVFVPVMFTEKWIGLVIPLQWLAIRAGIGTLVFNSGSIYKAIGRANVLTAQVAVRAVLLVVIVLLSVRYGIIGVAIGQVVMSVLSLVLDVFAVRYFIGVSPLRTWHAVRTSLIAAVGMGLVVWILVNQTPDLWPVARLGAAVVLGSVVYPLLLWLANPRMTVDMLRTAIRTLRPERAAVGK